MNAVRISLILSAMLVAAGCGDSNAGGTKWLTIKADDNSYAVSMPGRPKSIVQSADVPQGKIEMHMQELITKHVNYTVGYSEYPPDFLESMGSSVDAIFDRARDATVKQRNANLLEDKKGELAGFPSRTVVMRFAMPENAGDATMRQVMTLANERMYIVQSLVIAGAPETASEDIKRFHQSFELNIE